MTNSKKKDSEGLIGTEPLNKVSKEKFRSFCYSNIGEKKLKLFNKSDVDRFIAKIFNDKSEQDWSDVLTAMYGVEQLMDSEIYIMGNAKRIDEMEDMDVLVLGSCDFTSRNLDPGKSIRIMVMQPDGNRIFLSNWGGVIGGTGKDPHKAGFGEKLSLKVQRNTDEKTDATYINPFKVLGKQNIEKDKILTLMEPYTSNLAEFQETYMIPYEGEFFDGYIYSIRPNVILAQSKSDPNKSERVGWRKFHSKDKYDNDTYSFEVVLVDPENMNNRLVVNFYDQVLGSPYIDFGHHKIFEAINHFQEYDTMYDPAVEGVPNGVCFDETKDGKLVFNAKNCIPGCRGCIYSRLSRLAGMNVKVAVQMRSHSDTTKNGEKINFFNTTGYMIMKISDKRFKFDYTNVDNEPKKIETKKTKKENEPEDITIEDEETEQEEEKNKSDDEEKQLTLSELKKNVSDAMQMGMTLEEVKKMYADPYPNINRRVIDTIWKKLLKNKPEEKESNGKKESKKSMEDLQVAIKKFIRNNKDAMNVKNEDGVAETDDLKKLSKQEGVEVEDIVLAIKNLIDNDEAFYVTENEDTISSL